MGKALALAALTGSALVIASGYTYLVPGALHPFLLERWYLAADVLWLAGLRVHVACGIIALPSGLVLFSTSSRRPFHRMLGRIYGLIVLLLMAPTGVFLAAHAKYGWPSGSGFLVSAVIVAFTTVDAIRAARRGDRERHRYAAMRSYAQIASAITFRVYHLGFQAFEWPHDLAYVASVWLSVAGNAVIAELWIHKERSRHDLRNPHHLASLAAGR